MEFINELIELAKYVVDLFLRLDVHLGELVQKFGVWMYVILFVVVFCETGLVVTPFLPGDSLLFATGALAALDGSPLNVYLMGVLLFAAAVLGDACNYAIGRHLGPKVFASETSRFLNKQHLLRTQAFYEKHGGKTIILARFAPIFRTFAPFIAGIGKMSYPRFAAYNIIGAACWVVPFLAAGYIMGNQPAVKRNFHYIILAIIVISVMPAVVELIKARREAAHQKAAPSA